VQGDFEVGGSAPGARALRIVVDGDIDTAQRVVPGADGRWSARIDTSRLADAGLPHRVVAWDEAGGAASAVAAFHVERAWTVLAEADDPAGDDAGPSGRYQPPADPGYAAEHPMDLRHLRVASAGGALRFDLTMAGISTRWNPANGFDHVVFTIFIELPGQAGGTGVMPLQNASLPAGMRWQRRLRVQGWSNVLFGPEGASATNEGRPMTPAASIAVDRAGRTVSLVLPAAALDGASLHGARIYVSTWDYDGGYRPLAATAQAVTFGGGREGDPKLMDDMPVIVLP
jgi:carbohydrate-binding DOMON domain-containing protein